MSEHKPESPRGLRPVRREPKAGYPRLNRRNFLALLGGAAVFPALLKGCGAAPNSPMVYSATLPSSGDATAALGDGLIHYQVAVNFDSYDFSTFLEVNESAVMTAIDERIAPFSVDQLFNCGSCKAEAESDIQACMENLFAQSGVGEAGIMSLTLILLSSAPN